MDTHTSNSYRKSCEFAGTTGTLEHGPVTPAGSCDLSVPVSSTARFETGTLEHGPTGVPSESEVALFVSTGLESWTTDQPKVFARDVQINDTAYRRLDPEYYAWLRSKMQLAKMSVEAGQLGRDEFDELRRRYDATHDWAVAHFGELRLLDAIRDLDARDYAPPAAEPEAPPNKPRPADLALESALAAVNAIAEKAMALGWTRESLYRTSISSFGFNCGLAHFLKPFDRIGEVTTHWIEIIRANDIRHRFYNPNVDQPWIRRIKSSAE